MGVSSEKYLNTLTRAKVAFIDMVNKFIGEDAKGSRAEWGGAEWLMCVINVGEFCVNQHDFTSKKSLCIYGLLERAGSAILDDVSIDINAQLPSNTTLLNPEISDVRPYFYVYNNTPGASIDSQGRFTFFNDALVNQVGYLIVVRQQGPLSPVQGQDVLYNPEQGSFTILVPGFQLLDGYELVIWVNSATGSPIPAYPSALVEQYLENMEQLVDGISNFVNQIDYPFYDTIEFVSDGGNNIQPISFPATSIGPTFLNKVLLNPNLDYHYAGSFIVLEPSLLTTGTEYILITYYNKK